MFARVYGVELFVRHLAATEADKVTIVITRHEGRVIGLTALQFWAGEDPGLLTSDAPPDVDPHLLCEWVLASLRHHMSAGRAALTGSIEIVEGIAPHECEHFTISAPKARACPVTTQTDRPA